MDYPTPRSRVEYDALVAAKRAQDRTGEQRQLTEAAAIYEATTLPRLPLSGDDVPRSADGRMISPQPRDPPWSVRAALRRMLPQVAGEDGQTHRDRIATHVLTQAATGGPRWAELAIEQAEGPVQRDQSPAIIVQIAYVDQRQPPTE